MIRHMTVRKAANTFAALLEMSLKRPVLFSHPFFLRVEVSPSCNLRCPGCIFSNGNGSGDKHDHRKEKMMSFDLFKKSVDAFLPYLIKANLYDEGEPLLNSDIFRMINYLHINDVGTCISSNFSLKLTDRYLEELLSCGLDHLIVAVDGATQDVYAKYRVGGDLSLVLDNLERLTLLKKKTGSPLQIEIQFLEFSHNKNDRAAVRALATKFGADRFTVMEDCSTEGWEGLRFKGPEEERRKRGCYQLWIAATIDSAGEIGCCDYGEDHGMSNIGMASDYASDRLRNHPSIVVLRHSFRNNCTPLNTICRHCSLYKTSGKRS